MNAVVIFAALISCVAAQGRFRPVPQTPGQIIPIISQSSDISPEGNYQWSYESGNGIKAEERGGLKSPDLMEATGSFSYTADDGTPIQIQYIANENGFQPQGAHLPVAPPIPEAIQRALAWNAAHPEEEDGGIRRRL